MFLYDYLFNVWEVIFFFFFEIYYRMMKKIFFVTKVVPLLTFGLLSIALIFFF